ncbi:MAG: hypothetical protein GX087_05090 [Desulfobulbaceae bacterium]|nr:hypothetical protein [Desulfobulbaceae bacterium]
MLTTKQYRSRSIFLLSTFFVVLVLIFMPLYPDLQPGSKTDGLTFMDNFFNSLSKDSAYFVPQERERAKTFEGQAFEADLHYKSPVLAQQAAQVLSANGFTAAAVDTQVKTSGDFGRLLEAALNDADFMYQNQGEAIASKYPALNEKSAVYAWHNTLASLGKTFEKGGGEKAAMLSATQSVNSKALEPSYNYYQVERKPVRQNLPLLIFALVFYVIYTCWYGFGILYLFESLGVKLDH